MEADASAVPATFEELLNDHRRARAEATYVAAVAVLGWIETNVPKIEWIVIVQDLDDDDDVWLAAKVGGEWVSVSSAPGFGAVVRLVASELTSLVGAFEDDFNDDFNDWADVEARLWVIPIEEFRFCVSRLSQSCRVVDGVQLANEARA